VICVNVPNDFTPAQQSAVTALGLPQWWVAPPHHLNYFNFASLASLLERHGFDVNARTTSFPMEQFLLMGMNYVADPQLGRACHKQRKAFDLALDNEARRAYYQALAAAGFGREAVVIGTKK